MTDSVTVPVTDLLLDQENARFSEPVANQQDAIRAIAALSQPQLLNLAGDIVENGLDPTNRISVIATDDDKKRYVVVEGNRRVAALRALETPAIVASVLTSAQQARLGKLAKKYAAEPLESVQCVLFESAEEASHWIKLRHTGLNDGKGLRPWGSDEQDRYDAKTTRRSPEGQLLDFVGKHGALPEASAKNRKGIITNVARLLSTPGVREALGLEIVSGQLHSRYPRDETAKVLTHVVDDFKSGRRTVKDVYLAQDRIAYANSLPTEALPDPTKRLTSSLPLAGLPETARDAVKPGRNMADTAQPPPKAERARKPSPLRTTVIPKTVNLQIAPPRINEVYAELKRLSVDEYPNAASILLRVFLELSTDHYASANKVYTDNEQQNSPLAKRLKKVAIDLKKKARIPAQLLTAVESMADRRSYPMASTVTFNQYVHNQYVFPMPQELRRTWDEMHPLFAALWPG